MNRKVFSYFAAFLLCSIASAEDVSYSVTETRDPETSFLIGTVRLAVGNGVRLQSTARFFDSEGNELEDRIDYFCFNGNVVYSLKFSESGAVRECSASAGIQIREELVSGEFLPRKIEIINSETSVVLIGFVLNDKRDYEVDVFRQSGG